MGWRSPHSPQPLNGIPSFSHVTCTLQRIHSTPLSVPLIKMLQTTSPKVDPWGSLLHPLLMIPLDSQLQSHTKSPPCGHCIHPLPAMHTACISSFLCQLLEGRLQGCTGCKAAWQKVKKKEVITFGQISSLHSCNLRKPSLHQCELPCKHSPSPQTANGCRILPSNS